MMAGVLEVDRCVAWDIVPEGRQVCMKCELTNPKEFTSMIKKQVNTIKLTVPEIPPSNNKFMGRGTRYIQSIQYQQEKQKWAWLIKAAVKNRPKKALEKAESRLYIISYKTKTRPGQLQRKIYLRRTGTMRNNQR